MKLNSQLDFTVMSFTQLRVKLTRLAEFISAKSQQKPLGIDDAE
jgi:hypothetical protein